MEPGRKSEKELPPTVKASTRDSISTHPIKARESHVEISRNN
jgi:hypothetical protein